MPFTVGQRVPTMQSRQTAVLGAVTPSEVQRNLASLAATIPASLWSDLKAEGLLATDAPVPGDADDASH